MARFAFTSVLILAAKLASAQDQNETGQHPGWPRWCGKVYEAGYPSFEPGGHTTEPALINPDGSPNLYIQFKPRYSLYLQDENKGSFVVNAELSPWFGQPWTNSTSDGGSNTEPFTDLLFTISVTSPGDKEGKKLVEDSIPVNTTGAEFEFDLSDFTPRAIPYQVVLSGTSRYGDQNFTASSSFRYLGGPPMGSVTKIDNLNGGLLFRNRATNDTYVPLLPYGYYGLYNGSNSSAEAHDFVAGYSSSGKGLNAIVSLAGFADTNPVYDSMDQSRTMRFMFDLRGSYKNLTEVEQRVNTIKHHTSLFAYWTADEPDGWQAPFDLPPAAQELIHGLDPYHPVAVTLNCQDYYFGEYSSGADILMQDPYPIAINSTFSKWGTECNTTLGDCGCDNCAGNVQDVSNRLDDLIQYEKWLGRWPLPKFHNPQAFHGEDYWFRDPTTAEAFVMNALAFNRGATGIFAWTWPSSDELFDAHSQMAAVVTQPPVRDFLLSGRPTGSVYVAEFPLLDIAYWVRGDQVMVSVVNGAYEDIEDPLSLSLPVAATKVASVPFGGLTWELGYGQLTTGSLPGMSFSLIILALV
ncbi:hypothetical protein GGS26DRAFT_598959 [Hypomontagnella submonticulosa]|nr:hypothetical protein GGS26DRAFT_598959 [Hypomontagnella submonticulosa]